MTEHDLCDVALHVEFIAASMTTGFNSKIHELVDVSLENGYLKYTVRLKE